MPLGAGLGAGVLFSTVGANAGPPASCAKVAHAVTRSSTIQVVGRNPVFMIGCDRDSYSFWHCRMAHSEIPFNILDAVADVLVHAAAAFSMDAEAFRMSFLQEETTKSSEASYQLRLKFFRSSFPKIEGKNDFPVIMLITVQPCFFASS
jgi:hypothetical protein